MCALGKWPELSTCSLCEEVWEGSWSCRDPGLWRRESREGWGRAPSQGRVRPGANPCDLTQISEEMPITTERPITTENCAITGGRGRTALKDSLREAGKEKGDREGSRDRTGVLGSSLSLLALGELPAGVLGSPLSGRRGSFVVTPVVPVGSCAG